MMPSANEIFHDRCMENKEKVKLIINQFKLKTFKSTEVCPDSKKINFMIHHTTKNWKKILTLRINRRVAAVNSPSKNPILLFEQPCQDNPQSVSSRQAQKNAGLIEKEGFKRKTRAKSERKLPFVNHEIEVRKDKYNIAKKIVEKSPLQLVTRKLEWQGRDARNRAKIFHSKENLQRIKCPLKSPNLFKLSQRLEGWSAHFETEQNQYYF